MAHGWCEPEGIAPEEEGLTEEEKRGKPAAFEISRKKREQ